jgi:hypothetical protein
MLLLSRADVVRLMDLPAYVEAVEAGFSASACGEVLACRSRRDFRFQRSVAV